MSVLDMVARMDRPDRSITADLARVAGEAAEYAAEVAQ